MDQTQPRPARPSIDYLAQNRLPIYVLNCTKPPAPLFITIASPGMKPDSKIIPKTWIPFDLRTFASGEVLQYNADLRNLLAKRRLELLWPEDAEKRMEDPDAADELQRVATEPPLGGSMEASIDSGDEAATEIRANAAARRGAVQAQPSDEVRALVDNYREGVIQPRAVYSEVRTLANTFSALDLDYLIRNVDDQKVREFCAEQLRSGRTVAAQEIDAPLFESDDDVLRRMSPEEAEFERQRAAQALAEQQAGSAAHMRTAREKLARRLDGGN